MKRKLKKLGTVIFLGIGICFLSKASCAEYNLNDIANLTSDSSSESTKETATSTTSQPKPPAPKTNSKSITSLFKNLSGSLFGGTSTSNNSTSQSKTNSEKAPSKTIEQTAKPKTVLAPPAPSDENLSPDDESIEYVEDLAPAQEEGTLASGNLAINPNELSASNQKEKINPYERPKSQIVSKDLFKNLEKKDDADNNPLLDQIATDELALDDSDAPTEAGTLAEPKNNNMPPLQANNDANKQQPPPPKNMPRKRTSTNINNELSARKTQPEEIPDSIKNLLEKDTNIPEALGAGTLTNNDMPAVAKDAEIKEANTNAPPPRIFGTDVSNFNVAGIKLGMPLRSVLRIAQDNNYEIAKELNEIPNFAKWQYELACKNDGNYLFEGIQECVKQAAKQRKTYFTEKLILTKKASNEKIEVMFTSNFTGNLVKKISYFVQEDPTLGYGPKAKYIREQWVNDFWKRIDMKYGSPDDKERVTWGLGENEPSLNVSTGKIVLSDPKLPQKDYALMYKADKGINVSFSF
ncbi:MAG: hypothetical protein AB7U85_01745 [Alphaproteobacteria bacterium]